MSNNYVLIDEDDISFHIKNKVTGKVLVTADDFLNELNNLSGLVGLLDEKSKYFEEILFNHDCPKCHIPMKFKDLESDGNSFIVIWSCPNCGYEEEEVL